MTVTVTTVNNNEVNLSCLLRQEGEPKLLTQKGCSVGRVGEQAANGMPCHLCSFFLWSECKKENKLFSSSCQPPIMRECFQTEWQKKWTNSIPKTKRSSNHNWMKKSVYVKMADLSYKRIICNVAFWLYMSYTDFRSLWCFNFLHDKLLSEINSI
jgi:hypothetical protein